MRLLRSALLSLSCLFAMRAVAEMPPGAYLDGKDSKVAVVLAHGQGLHPDGNVVGPLRRALNQELGYHTLSLQMPTVAGAVTPESPELAATFPDGHRRIQAAIDFLRNGKGVERIYLMGHSMGGRMTSSFLASNPDAPVAGFIGVGLTAGGPEPVNTNLNLRKVRVPVINVYGENDQYLRAAELRRPLVSERYVQVSIPGAKHDYRGYEKPVAEAVVAWLKKQEAR